MGDSDNCTQGHRYQDQRQYPYPHRPPSDDGGGKLPPVMAAPALVSAQEAILFVTALQGPAEDLLQLLASTLQRLQLHATQQRVVALQDEPELGRRYRVRVAPCLVLDTGTRQIQLPGELARLDPLRVEHALTRQ